VLKKIYNKTNKCILSESFCYSLSLFCLFWGKEIVKLNLIYHITLWKDFILGLVVYYSFNNTYMDITIWISNKNFVCALTVWMFLAWLCVFPLPVFPYLAFFHSCSTDVYICVICFIALILFLTDKIMKIIAFIFSSPIHSVSILQWHIYTELSMHSLIGVLNC